MSKKARINACLLEIAENWSKIESEEKKSIMKKDLKDARFFITLCIIFMWGGELPYNVLPFTNMPPYVINNKTFNYMSYQSYFVFFNPHVSINENIDESARVCAAFKGVL